MKETATTLPVLSSGTILGEEYQIIRLIGEGGMGAVYLAYDTHLDIKVAIKVISAGDESSLEASEYNLALKRFQAEARIAVRIDHPNVIRMFGLKHDIIECDGQSSRIDYLVMELMAERTLRDTMDESGFESEEEIMAWITRYMIPLLDGLEKVHEEGIIHRDIKPENIFMKEDVAKLADFGLSMGHDFPSVTGSMAEIFGTLAYMAPEQYNNFSMAREPADIFAIGRILFEAVEGTITEKVIPFTQVQLTSIDTKYTAALNHIVMEATAKNPTDRIKSVRELKKRLIEIHQCPVNISAVKDEGVERKWKTQYLWLLLVVAFIGLTLFVTKSHLNTNAIVAVTEQQDKREIPPSPGNMIVYGEYPKGLKRILHAEDDSILHLIPSLKLKLPEENPYGKSRTSSRPFYLSESPITNQQYVDFLNTILDRVEYKASDVLLDGRLVLKLSEKIRGYKPILFNNGRFHIQHPMHSSCAVLMVTGYGAETYARYFGFRLVTAEEWLNVLASNENNDNPHLSLIIPRKNLEYGALIR
ncbi:protein kinase [Desulfotalea psychrophila]|uniref:non-specific serine/threonine protein kinase n=1 Tax=Desulfotalea psychrophila TaxID=84980 RepID=A0ABS3AV57_9BACT|nr:protein kinase [Desulfotalea psychrophila]